MTEVYRSMYRTMYILCTYSGTAAEKYTDRNNLKGHEQYEGPLPSPPVPSSAHVLSDGRRREGGRTLAFCALPRSKGESIHPLFPFFYHLLCV